MKKFRNPENIHKPLGNYVHQVEITGNERMLILSGQVGMREDGSVPDDPLEQLEVVFENILKDLHAANMEMRDLVKLNYYLVGKWDTVKRRALAASKLGGHNPATTLIYVAALVSPVYKVEVEAWASRPV
jgi:2-iminobutanoate/2-iminopropanoate deaminase